MQLQDLQDDFKKVLSKRIQIFSTTHKDSQDVISTLRECEQLINKENQSLRSLLYYLIINITKPMELRSLDANGIKRFNQKYFHSVKHKIAYGFQPFLNNKLIIKQLTDKLIIDQVKQRLKNNKKVIEIILMEQIQFKLIDQYFKEIQIYTYSNRPLAKCISSYDGKFIFVQDDDTILQNLEFAAVNNIYFWLIKNRNPFLILTELNSSIMLEHLPIEACDFYSYHVYNKRFNFNPHNIVGIQYY